MCPPSCDSSEVILGLEPVIHPSAEVRNTTFGRYCEVSPGAKVIDSVLGDYSYVMEEADIMHATLGKFANIAARVRLNPGQHPMHRASLHHFQYRSHMYGLGDDEQDFFAWRREKPVILGHDVWIGHAAVIQSGVTIGTGAVVGSNAVVTKDVPPYTIVAGVPARPLRERFPADIQAALHRIAWWDWDHETLKATLHDFRALSIEAFCQKYDRS